jgi:hypothetical protein
MPQNSLSKIPGQVDPALDSSETSAAGPEGAEDRLKEAKAILAGQCKARAMVTLPRIDSFLESGFNDQQVPPLPEAVRQIKDWLNLQGHYGGRPVACCKTADGVLAVLAVGDEQIESILKGLTSEERARVVVEDPDPTV